MDDIVAGHFGGRVIDHDAFEYTLPAKDQVDDPREIEHPGTGPVSCSDQARRGMRRIDDIHAFAVFDLLAWHTDFLEDLMRRSTDRRLVHQKIGRASCRERV